MKSFLTMHCLEFIVPVGGAKAQQGCFYGLIRGRGISSILSF